VVKGKSFGKGVWLIGMPVVVVQLLCTVRHGLKASFAAVGLVPGVLFVVVVLVATTVAVESSS